MAPPSTPSRTTATKTSTTEKKYRITRRPLAERPKVGTQAIKILVGEKEEPFLVHLGHLRSTSDFFQRALRVGATFKENNESILRLSQFAPETFSLYVEYIYTGELSIESDDRKQEQTTIAKLVVLADYLQSTELHNVAVDAFVNRQSPYLGPTSLAAVKIARDGLRPDSPFMRLLVDMWIWRDFAPRETEVIDRLSEGLGAFWFKVAQGKNRFMKSGSWDKKDYPWVVDKSQYYCEKVDENVETSQEHRIQ
ncbi:hypothetical protein BT63DRAFT_472819 [Microthyrium microscopicum]|uniref:BTB domain-containing protein n=1 Tax=Microthyrium microscopicum TaxID=703497 RepID=A0A6A6U9V9_9PEZI|nr:hypothetical protein BT63DRAFT_472819 [Microthyrium microscopicum]